VSPRRPRDHHYVLSVAGWDAEPELKGRIRGIATEANRGHLGLIESLPGSIISVFGVGVDAVDLARARARDSVTNTPGYSPMNAPTSPSA
jgi:lactate dehydrogenase-like 2-hydroxyacid dehydrogenase